MANEVMYSSETDESVNLIYYGIALQMLKDLLNKELLTREEFYKIDELNRRSFHQDISSENSAG